MLMHTSTGIYEYKHILDKNTPLSETHLAEEVFQGGHF
jgi:hypothetical protein